MARRENCFRNVAAQTASVASYQPHHRHPNPPFSLFDRLSVNHRLAFRFADITLEPLTHLLGELLISDEPAKVIGKLIVEYRLETLRGRDIQARRPSASSALLFLRPEPGYLELCLLR